MVAPREFLRSRLRWAGCAGALGLGVTLASPAPPEPTVAGLAGALGAEAGVVVEPRDVAWEPSGGLLEELLYGRRLLFLGAPARGAPRDVFRAAVRVSRDGKPLSVHALRNLTETPLGDDAGLHVRGARATFATVAFGKVQAISVLELAGPREQDLPPGRLHRLLHAVTAFQETASFRGIGRTDIVLDVPAPRARLKLAAEQLSVELGASERSFAYDFERREALGASGAKAYGARVIPQRVAAKPLILWAVDTVRAEVGPEPIAWLEDQVFGARDVVKRTTYSAFASKEETQLKANTEQVVAEPVALDPRELHAGAETWPPPPIPSLWQEPKPGEGEWEPVDLPWLKPMPGTKPGERRPAYFQQTKIRPDPKRPYAELLLIAMDMRQLELGMQAGFEDPKPLTGPPGSGRLPKDEEVTRRIVGTFNGAFKTTHGSYGMMAEGRVLLPPVPGAATVVVTQRGDVGLGSWPSAETIPPDIIAFRQNLDPLVEDGVANPTGRNIWGWQLNGTSVMTERTALCVTRAGHLYYAWGKEIDGPTLGQALRQAGCSYGMHLDMNPKHCGFVYTDIASLAKKEFNLQRADQGMDINVDKFVRWSPKDFFYVMVRDATPRDPSGIRWQPEAAMQPAPPWLPAIYEGSLSVGGLVLRLLSVEPGRVSWRVRAGTLEPNSVGAAPKVLELSGDERFRALAAVGLGHTTDALRLGLAFGPKASLPLGAGHASLVARRDGRLEVLPSGPPRALEPGDSLAQLPLLADGQQLLPRALEHGPMRQRGALCVTDAGRVLIATAAHDSSDPLASALLRIGCRRVVELDRGSRHPAFLHRAGGPTPPLARYETSVLYALAEPMMPHAFRWHPGTTSSVPTLYDYRGPGARRVPAPAPAESAVRPSPGAP